jgi:hypothetical protein
VLDVIAKDLRAAAQSPVQNYESGNPTTPTNDARQMQMLVNPTTLPTDLQNAGSIFWTTSQGTTTGGTSLVGYFLRWETPASGGVRPVLCRYFVSGSEVHNRLQTLRAQTPSNTVWVDSSDVTAVAPADQNNGFQGWLADGVLAIYFRVLDPEGRPISNYARRPIRVAYGRFNPKSGDYTHYRAEFNPSSPDLQGDAITSNFYDSLLGFSYRRSVGSVWLNVSGPTMPPLVEIILVTAPMRLIKRLSTAPTRVDSGVPSNVWNDVDAFVAGLPSYLKNEARVASTTVALTR